MADKVGRQHEWQHAHAAECLHFGADVGGFVYDVDTGLLATLD